MIFAYSTGTENKWLHQLILNKTHNKAKGHLSPKLTQKTVFLYSYFVNGWYIIEIANENENENLEASQKQTKQRTKNI